MAIGNCPGGCRVLTGQEAGITPTLSRVPLERRKTGWVLMNGMCRPYWIPFFSQPRCRFVSTVVGKL
jgi:hypothetical protein